VVLFRDFVTSHDATLNDFRAYFCHELVKRDEDAASDMIPISRMANENGNLPKFRIGQQPGELFIGVDVPATRLELFCVTFLTLRPAQRIN